MFKAFSRSFRITDGFRLAFKHADQLIHSRREAIGKRGDTDRRDRSAVGTENRDTHCPHALHEHVEEYGIAALARALHFIFEPCHRDIRILLQTMLYQRQDGVNLSLRLPRQQRHRSGTKPEWAPAADVQIISPYRKTADFTVDANRLG